MTDNPHDPNTCPYCRATAAMRQIVATLAELPTLDVQEDADLVYDVYEAALTAAHELRCYSEDLSDD